MSGAAQVGECRARALESGALDSWLSRERLLCGADFRSLKFRSWPTAAVAPSPIPAVRLYRRSAHYAQRRL